MCHVTTVSACSSVITIAVITMTKMQWITLVQLLLALLEGYCMEVVSSSSRLPDIYWNASNPM